MAELNKIYIGRLSRSVKESDLQSEFSKFGKVKDIELRSSYAFLSFESESEAKEAAAEMDGKTIEDSRIVVQLKG